METQYKPASETINNFLSKEIDPNIVKELDSFFCNSSLDKSEQKKLISILNKMS